MAHPEEEIITKARTTVRLQLTQIAQLDQQVETKTALSEQLQAHLLNKLETEKQLGEITKSEENMRLYNQIMDILEQIQQLSQQKVRIANNLYCSIANSCDQIDQLFQNLQNNSSNIGQQSQNSIPKGDWLIRNLIAQCQRDEIEQICICSPEQKKSIFPEEIMVFCQGKECPKRWYHLRCLRIKVQDLPEHWLCDFCKDGNSISLAASKSKNS